MTFRVTAGLMYLKTLAFEEGVELSYDEDKNRVHFRFLCKVEGTDEAIWRFESRYLKWLKLMEAGEEWGSS